MNSAFTALDNVTVPDHWPEIVERAAQDVTIVALAPSRSAPPRLPLLRAVAAVAAAVALVGAGVVYGRATVRKQNVGTVDPATHGWTVGAAIPVPAPDISAVPLIANSGRDIYAAFRGDRALVEADQGGFVRTTRFSDAIVAIAAGRDQSNAAYAVVLTSDGTVTRVDADAHQVTLAHLGVRRPLPSMVVAGTTVFVAGSARGGLATVALDGSGATGVVAALTPTLLAAEGDAVWAVDQKNGTLSRILVPSLRVANTAHVNDVVAVAAHGGDLYLARPGAAVLSRVDATFSISDVAQIDPQTEAISVGSREIWTAALGVLTAYAPNDGRVIGAVARPNRDPIALTFDGTTTRVLTATDGLRQLLRTN